MFGSVVGPRQQSHACGCHRAERSCKSNALMLEFPGLVLPFVVRRGPDVLRCGTWVSGWCKPPRTWPVRSSFYRGRLACSSCGVYRTEQQIHPRNAQIVFEGRTMSMHLPKEAAAHPATTRLAGYTCMCSCPHAVLYRVLTLGVWLKLERLQKAFSSTSAHILPFSTHDIPYRCIRSSR